MNSKPLKEKVFDKKEYNVISINMPSERDLIMFKLMFEGAMRVSEMLNVKIGDINFIDNKILITRGKFNKMRYINITDETSKKLYDYVYNLKQLNKEIKNQKEIKLFPITRQRIWQIIKKIADVYFVDGNRRVSPHSFRHSAATTLLKSGADLTTIQKYLGHESINTTTIYLSINDEDVKQSWEKVFGKQKGILDVIAETEKKEQTEEDKISNEALNQAGEQQAGGEEKDVPIKINPENYKSNKLYELFKR